MALYAAFKEQCLVELRRPVPPVTHLRGTAITVSLAELEQRGLGHRYWAHLPQAFHGQVRDVAALSWVEMDLTMAHYRALDALELGDAECISLGRAAADRVQSTLTSTLARSLRATGNLTAATLLSRADTLWARITRGGGVRTVQTGPKDLRCELHGAPYADLRYNRLAWVGYFENALAPTARRVIVRQLAQPAPGAAAYRVSWV